MGDKGKGKDSGKGKSKNAKSAKNEKAGLRPHEMRAREALKTTVVPLA